MDRMVSDARSALAAHHQRADLKSSSATPSITSMPSPSTLPPNLVSALARVSHLPLLLIEVQGWILHNEVFIEACDWTKPSPGHLCAEWAPPCRTLQSQILLGGSNELPMKDWQGLLCRLMKPRAGPGGRREENGARSVYFEAKSSGGKYHERIPLCRRTQTAGRRLLNIFARLLGLAMFQTGRGLGILLVVKKKRENILPSNFRNVPAVIYLDSTTSTVDHQLVEVLNRLVSHLQVDYE